MTQSDLANILGIPYQSIGQWERNTRNPKYETLEKIAHALNCSVRYLKDGHSGLIAKKIKWESDKAIAYSTNIDSELFRLLNILAEEDNLSLDDEIETILHDEVEARVEEAENNFGWQ